MRLVVLVALVAALVRGEQSRACGGWAYDPTQGLTFDTTIGEPDNGALYFGDELLAEWKAYLRETGVSDAEWKKILFEATDKELEQVATKWKSKARVVDAIAFVRLARRVEPFATFDVPKPAAESADVLADAKAAFAKAKDPFMVQRYGFQITRVLFYQHDWPGVIAWFDKNADYELHAVGSKEANPWSLHDMHGNVAEWTLDQYAETYFQQMKDVAADPVTLPVSRNPRTVKGGTYQDEATGLRPANRRESELAWNRRDPQIPKSKWWNADAPFIGFRIIRPVKQPNPEEAEKFFDLYLIK